MVHREVKGSQGFGATSRYRQHFGLRKRTRSASLEMWWPSGVKEVFTALEANQIIAVREDRQEREKVE